MHNGASHATNQNCLQLEKCLLSSPKWPQKGSTYPSGSWPFLGRICAQWELKAREHQRHRNYIKLQAGSWGALIGPQFQRKKEKSASCGHSSRKYPEFNTAEVLKNNINSGSGGAGGKCVMSATRKLSAWHSRAAMMCAWVEETHGFYKQVGWQCKLSSA